MSNLNVFEKIVAGILPSNKVLENEEFLAFHDINPKAPVHILIIPKKRFTNFQEVDANTMAKMTTFIQEVAVKLGLDKSGYKLLTNNGSDAGQEVFHLHFHMLGGLKLFMPKVDENNEGLF